MNARLIPRAAVDGYLKVVRLPLDGAIRLLYGRPGSIALTPVSGTTFLRSPRGDHVTLAGRNGIPTVCSPMHLGETAATVILVRGTTFYFARQMDLQATLRIAAGNDPDAPLDAGNIVLELQRSLDFYERHFDQPPITRIAVSPSGKRASLLAADLGRETGFEVDTIDLASLLRCETSIEAAVDPGCLLAVGAALREEHRSL